MLVNISYVTPYATKLQNGRWIREVKTEVVHDSMVYELASDLELHGAELLWKRDDNKGLRPDIQGEFVIEPKESL